MRTAREVQLSGRCAPDWKLGKPQRSILRKALGSAVSLAILLTAPEGCGKKEAPGPPAPPEVAVTEVVQKDVPIYNEWVAQLNGPVNAEITPKVQGYLLKQDYPNGYFVRKGQLLFELDPRQYQAALDSAKASVARAEANLERCEADVARDTPLAAQNAIPAKQLDNDTASRNAAVAEVKAQKASQDNAELNLAWTRVYSPIDGIAGAATSQIGDLVGPSTKMTTVSQVDPIWAYFNVSESSFLRVAPQVTNFITGKARPESIGRTAIQFIQANDVPYPEQGHFVYVNRQIGTQTGTIQMAAAFANPQAVLRPGGFGRVRFKTGDRPNALLVPQAAVIEVQSQYLMIVLTPDNKAKFVPVQVGDRVGSNWIITQGLTPGDRVVVEGSERVQMIAAARPQLAKDGIPVIPKPYVRTAAAGESN